MIECKRSRWCCQTLLPQINWKVNFNNSFPNHCLELNSILYDEEFALWCIGCCAIWNDRNSLREGRPCPNVASKCAWIERYLADYRNTLDKVCSGLLGQRSVPQEAISGWECPDAGWFKLNVDASCSDKCGKTGVGAIIRDGRGVPLVALVNCFDALYPPLLAGAQACLSDGSSSANC